MKKYGSLIISWLCPVYFIVFGFVGIKNGLHGPVHPDAEHVYLPAAQAWIEQGWSFFLSPESYRVVPLAYLWPALWGADPVSIRLANVGLWAGCVVFIWCTCRNMWGYLAGFVALAIFATHPLILGYFSTELTEPIFLFGIFGWIYSVSRMIGSEKSIDWIAVGIGAASLCVTLLSRPVLQIVAPGIFLLALSFYVVCGYSKNASNGVEENGARCIYFQLAVSTGMGLLIPIALVLKNGFVFGLWGLGTGAGTGLYLGTNPLFQGAEPAFLGLDYDVNILARILTGDDDHLALAGDRAAREAAMWQIFRMPFMEGFLFFAKKFWWWMVHHPAQMGSGGVLRKIRFIEWAIVLIYSVVVLKAVVAGARKGMADRAMDLKNALFSAFLLCMLMVMLAQLLPILYNNRYGAALLDPWIILLTSFGVAWFAKTVRVRVRIRKNSWAVSLRSGIGNSTGWFVFSILFVLLAVVAGNYFSRRPEKIQINPLSMGSKKTIFEIMDVSRASGQKMQEQGEGQWVSTEHVSVLHIAIDKQQVDAIAQANPFNAVWESDFSIAAPDGRSCKNVEAALRLENGEVVQPHNTRPLILAVRADGVPQKIVFHANHEMRPQAIASLRVVFHCPAGTRIRWGGTRFVESRHIHDAIKQLGDRPMRSLPASPSFLD